MSIGVQTGTPDRRAKGLDADHPLNGVLFPRLYAGSGTAAPLTTGGAPYRHQGLAGEKGLRAAATAGICAAARVPVAGRSTCVAVAMRSAELFRLGWLGRPPPASAAQEIAARNRL